MRCAGAAERYGRLARGRGFEAYCLPNPEHLRDHRGSLLAWPHWLPGCLGAAIAFPHAHLGSYCPCV